MTMQAHSQLIELRCSGCRRLLARYAIELGAVQVKCGTCNMVNTVEKGLTITSQPVKVYSKTQ